MVTLARQALGRQLLTVRNGLKVEVTHVRLPFLMGRLTTAEEGGEVGMWGKNSALSR